MTKDELIILLERIAKEVDEDPNMWKKEEDFYRKYGTLTERERHLIFKEK